MNDSNLKKLKDIFESDSLGLLIDDESEKAVRTPEDQRLIEGFQQICDFYEAQGKCPQEDGDMEEYMLAHRLKAIRANPKKVKLLQPFDLYNLLDIQNTTTVTIDDILKNDPLGILDDVSGDTSIFTLSHVKPTDRIRPDYIAHRKVCKDFLQFKKVFDMIARDLEIGRRKLVEYKRGALLDGHFYVLRGVMFLLQFDKLKVDPRIYESGTYNRLDGRTRCIFDNGTESNMLYRSLEKAMNIDGFCISEPIDDMEFDQVTDDDVQNGYIYVLKSQSNNPSIRAIKDLYKIGYCSGSVTERVKNARNEPTYLLSDVTIILTVRCFNMNTRYLESAIHDFFVDANIAFEVRDRRGNTHYPREWFSVPLGIVEEAVKLIVAQEGEHYKYDPHIGKIIKRAL